MSVGLPRRKKVCGRCEHWSGFPYVHCMIGCDMTFTVAPKETPTGKTLMFTSKPSNPLDCRDRRRNKLTGEK